MYALRSQRTPKRDYPSRMVWRKPFWDVRTTHPTIWDAGNWFCAECGMSFPAYAAEAMIDAVLRIDDREREEFPDAQIAGRGGHP